MNHSEHTIIFYIPQEHPYQYHFLSWTFLKAKHPPSPFAPWKSVICVPSHRIFWSTKKKMKIINISSTKIFSSNTYSTVKHFTEYTGTGYIILSPEGTLQILNSCKNHVLRCIVLSNWIIPTIITPYKFQ